MNNKKCPFCNSPECIKKGFQQGHQRWQCKKCKTKFQANKKVPQRVTSLILKLESEYIEVFH